MQWSRLGKAHIGVDSRSTASKYGFNGKVFWEEIHSKAGRICRTDDMAESSIREAAKERQERVLMYDGILKQECEQLFKYATINRAMRRRFAGKGGDQVLFAYKEVSNPEAGGNLPPTGPNDPAMAVHEQFMRMAMAVAARGSKLGLAKEHECFGAVVVKDGNVIADACNSVLSDRDATATAAVKAIRSAAQRVGSYSLEGCDMYVTVQPDLMSLGAILWSGISRVYCGVTQQFVAQRGFEEGYLHWKDLLERESGGSSVIQVVKGVAAVECEAVFKEWYKRNGVLY
jgi:tRNA(Arg) A34 adenosine deaminase TadA